jgi:hypothetical protein
MNIQFSLLLQSLVKPFYKQHAGILCFLFFMMTLAVGRANGVGLLEYHYSLITGMLINPSFLAAVLVIWALYAARCCQCIIITLRKPAFSWLYMLSQVHAGKVYLLLFLMQLILFLPVLVYLIFVLGVGYYNHWYLPSNLALLFTISVCALVAYRYLYQLQHPTSVPFFIRWKLPAVPKRTYYVHFLLGYVLEKGKLLFLLIKIYSCGVIYLMMTGRHSPEEDLRMVTLFFSFGALGHSVLIHRIREMENTRLSFFRGLPISLTRRFAQYACFYFCVFMPDIIMLASVAPAHLYYGEAFFFIFFGYSLLLLLNSLQLYDYKGMKDYLIVVVQLFMVIIMAVIPKRIHELSLLFFLLSIIIFFRRYYRFEPKQVNAL